MSLRAFLVLLLAAAAHAGPTARVVAPRLNGTPALALPALSLARPLTLSAAANGLTPSLTPLLVPALAPLPAAAEAPRAFVAPVAAPGASPVSALSVLEKAFAENPEEAAQVDRRVAVASVGRLFDGGDYKADLAEAFAPYIALSGGGETREQRQALMKTLAHNTGHRAEEWTYLFRDHPLWKDGLDGFLDSRIAERRASGERRLDLQSVGAAYGSEPYTLAITADRALRRNGEDPGAWDVRIPAYDVSLLSLLTAGKGLYRLGPRDASSFERSGAGEYFTPGPAEGLHLLKPELTKWIRPVWADLNDPRQQALVTAEKPDAVFANYLLFHLRLAAGAALGQHWLSGSWAATRGFLSMAQVVVAEVGASPRESAPLEKPLLSQFGGNVGIAGRMFYGENHRAPGGVRRVWRDWRRSKTADGRAAEAARGLFMAALYKDPTARGRLDSEALAALEDVSRRHGVPVVLTNEDLSMLWSKQENRLYVNVGLVLAGRTQALKAWAEQELSGRAPAPSAPSVSAVLLEGAPVTIASEDGARVLRWLEKPVTVVSDAFRSDNANKTPEELEEERKAAEAAARRSNPVRGLN